MYQDRFRYLYGVLALLGAAGIAAGVIALALSVGDPKIETREVPQALLTSSSSVADAGSRFDGAPAQSIPGEQLGLQGGTCDVYVLSDGGVLLCHA